MEEADTEHEEAPEPSVLHQNQDDKNRLSTLENGENSTVEEKEEFKQESNTQEEDEENQKGIMNLQRNLTALVTNIQTAADAKEMERRARLTDACKIRREQVENDAKTSEEKLEEIARGWSKIKQKMIYSDVQRVQESQQKLCTALVEDKKKLIKDLQRELRMSEDQFLKNLRRLTEEKDLMIERMQEQLEILTKAYREELAQTQRVHQEELEILLTKDKAEWEQHMQEFLDKELKRLMERRDQVEEYEKKLHSMIFENANIVNIKKMENNAKSQAHERTLQQMKGTAMVMRLRQIRQTDQEKAHKVTLIDIKSRIFRTSKEMKNLKTKYTKQKRDFTKQNQHLSEVYKRCIQQYEQLQNEVKHSAIADAQKFKEMWLMLDEEAKQLVEKALVIDSLISQHLGLAWKQPSMPFMEQSGPIQPQKQAMRSSHQLFQMGNASRCIQDMMDASVGPNLETDSEHAEEVEEGKLSMETLKKVLELLCDEMGFLVEGKLKLMAPLEKWEQPAGKMETLFNILGLEDTDVPKLANSFLKYEHQQSEQKEAVCAESSDVAERVETSNATKMTSELIDRNHILPALKLFLEQHRKENSALQHSHFWHLKARNMSVDEAYWKSMGNIISEDKVKLWDATETALNQYKEVLEECSELIPECELLEQQNSKLRIQLQQILTSAVP